MNPIKATIRTEIFPIIFLIAGIISSIYFYSVFPEQVPIHWNIEGEVDSYGSKVLGAFLFPAIALGVYLLMLLIPMLDPKKERYSQFRKAYHTIKALIVIHLLTLYFVASLNAIGYDIQINLIVPVMVGILFIVIGNYLGKVKPNWFMGIRNPWTLSSEEVWNKTHRLSAKLFILAGLVFILMPLMSPELSTIAIIAVSVLLVLVTSLYSLYLYLKEKNGKNNEQGEQEDQTTSLS